MPTPSVRGRRPATVPRSRAAVALGLAGLLLPWLTGCSGFSLPFFGPDRPAATYTGRPLQWGDPPEAARQPADPSYRIGPEDALEIAVWRDDTLKSTVLVRPDGGISFPLAGDFIVAGKTAAEVRDELVRRLSRFVPDPVVNVAVQRVASLHIYVLGRVNRPGDFTVGRHIDVLQALTLAGGMTPFAVEDGIQIIRRVDSRSVSIPFRFSRVRSGVDLAQNIPLQSGDVVLVP